MVRSGFCSAVSLLATLVVTANCQAESREWTSPFSRWTTPSTITSVKNQYTEHTHSVFSVCDDKCCECVNNKSRVECISSSLCKELTLNNRNHLPKEAKTVIITGFRRLKVIKGSLGYSQNLQTLIIERIEQIETEPYALSQPSCSDVSGRQNSLRPTLVINASSIANLQRRTLTGAWNEIIISNSNLKMVEAESFYNIYCLKKLTIEGNSISEIKSKALFDSQAQYLDIKGNEIKSIESGAFLVNVSDSVNIVSNKLNHVQSEAFVLRTPRIFRFLNNTVGNLYPYAFQMTATEKIDLLSNTFERIARHAFHAIQTVGNAKITIAVTVEKFDSGAFDLNESLFISSFQKLDIIIENMCDCGITILLDTLFSTVSDATSRDADGTSIRSLIRNSVSCKTDNGTEKFYIFALFHDCQLSSAILLASIGGAISVVLAMAGIGVMMVVRVKAKFRGTREGRSKVWMMRAYTESECKVEEEFVHPLEIVGENGVVFIANHSERGPTDMHCTP